jgi:uncharacterized protein YdaU (DUF1376 family)
MPFLVNDWLSSLSVSLMTLDEQGAYLRLLCHAWSDPDCCLPDDDSKLALLSGLGPKWSEGSGLKIRAKFVPDETRQGHIFNAKQRGLRSDQTKRLKAAKDKATKAANSRWHRQSNPQALPENSSSNAQASSEHMLGDASSLLPRHSLAGERAADAERPSQSEVLAHASTIGLAAWKAIDWFEEMQGGGWLDYAHRPIADWKSVLNRVRTKWEADGRPMTPPTAQRQLRGATQGSKPDHSKEWK